MGSLTGFLSFLLYFVIGGALVALYLAVYMFATAHNEFVLIRKNVLAAAVALGLSLLGFAIPLSSAIIYSAEIGRLVLWGVVALGVQIAVYWLVRLVLPDLSQRIAANELGAALFLGAASVAGGMINAASMTF